MTDKRDEPGDRGNESKLSGASSSQPMDAQEPVQSKGEFPGRAWQAVLVFARAVATLARRLGLVFWAVLVRGWNHGWSQWLRRRVARAGSDGLGYLRDQRPRLRYAARSLVRYGVLLGGLVMVVFLGGRFALHSVEPGEVGVRYSKWGGGGVSAEDFGPGLHFSLPGLHKWHDMPVGSELMTWRGGRGLDVRTTDGSTVALELSVPIHLERGGAHRVVAEGNRGTYRQLARAKMEPILLDAFGRLDSEEFYDSERRGVVLSQALVDLNASLLEMHVEAEEVLVEAIKFSEAYEKKLLQTQRARQRGRVLEAQQAQDQEHMIILRKRIEIEEEVQERRIALDQQIEALAAASMATAAERYLTIEKYESDLGADADREYERLVAQGQATVLGAKKLERSLRGEILTGAGGAEYLTLQAARSTRLSEVVLNANDPRVPNPMDIGDMLDLFSIE